MLRLGFAAQFNILDVHKRSGTPYYIAKNMEAQGIGLDYICPLKAQLSFPFKMKRLIKNKFCAQQDSARWQVDVAKKYAAQVKSRLSSLSVDGVFTHILTPLAYLDCDLPLFLWTDVLYANHLGFFAGFNQHSATTIHEANAITRAFLQKTKLAIFSSEWAARGAIEIYGASKEKIKVVPYGANLDSAPTDEEIKTIIQQRSKKSIQFLFLGKDWHGKGGDTVLSVVTALHLNGYTVHLHIVGCHPPKDRIIPNYVTCHGYLSKRHPQQAQMILTLLTTSHFLFVPSRAEAYGIVFCEANAYGLPCLTSYVGGIPVRDGINGQTFSLHAPIEKYCNYIINLMQNRACYEELAYSAYQEYCTNLNWTSAVANVKKLIQETIAST